jgi:hypothetical protein
MYPVDTVIARSSVIFIVLPNRFAKTDCKPSSIKRAPQNLARKMAVSTI